MPSGDDVDKMTVFTVRFAEMFEMESGAFCVVTGSKIVDVVKK